MILLVIVLPRSDWHTIAWGLGYAYNIYGGGELSWLRIMYGRKSAIAAEIDAPRRLLITGGSGAHYTINSELMEQELGIPVVNLGLDGKVALNVIVAGALEQIRRGDTLLLIAEYPLLQDPDGFDERSATFGIAIGQPGLANVPLKQFVQDGFLLGVPSLRSLAKSSVDLLEKGHLTGYYSGPLNDSRKQLKR